eukprot:TCONS_00010354-protein
MYNMVPDNESKVQASAMKFPMGAKIRISEPFYKIFRDGNHGIRVDSPAEIQVYKEGEFNNFLEAREEGKKLFKAGNHLQAFEVYYDALRQQSGDLIKFLAKRAQVEFNLGNYMAALFDSAAVLLIENKNEASRSTYNLSLEKIVSEKGDVKNIWSVLLPGIYKNSQQTSRSKFPNSEEFSIIFNNLARASIQTQMFQTAISASNACLRIAKNGSEAYKKARYAITQSFSMLGELELSEIAGKGGGKSLEEFWNIEKTPERISVELLPKIIMADSLDQMNHLLLKEEENIDIDYIAKDLLRNVYIDGKGRGLVATSKIKAGTLLVVDHMIYSNFKFDRMEFTQSHEVGKKVNFADRNSLISKLLNLFQYDGLLGRKFQMLYHQRYLESDHHSLPLIEDLPGFAYRSLSPNLSPFLPQTPSEVGVDTTRLTRGYIQSVLDANVFRWGIEAEYGGLKEQEGTALLLRISLFNHDVNPNCVQSLIGETLAVFALRDIDKGDELTLFYSQSWNKKLMK